jgi:diguanylate cyclase (GGDEF)-like protein
MQALAGKLDETLKVYGSEPVDWDRAREVLVEVSRTLGQINAQLDYLAAASHADVAAAGETTRDRIHGVVQVVAAFSVLLGVIAAFVGYYVSWYLRESAEREKLAMFAEKNPNPMLRLSGRGELLYANPGAARMLEGLGAAAHSPLSLLPAGVAAVVQRMLAAGGEAERLQYRLSDRTLECELHPLPAHGVVHCYLADITDRVRAEEELRFHVFHDTVTGLPNPLSFERAIDALPQQAPAALLLLNIDRFRQLLTDLGPHGTDDVLKAFAMRLTEVAAADATAPVPQLFRFEGDSFALLLTGPEVMRRAGAAAQAILDALAHPLYEAAREIFLSASIGTSLAPEHGPHDTLFRHAGAALQSVKQAGGGHVALYTHEMTARVAHRVALEAELRRALERDELSLNLQPQAELRAGCMIGGEVLLRWHRTNGGAVSPAQFIPVAEDTGLILPIASAVVMLGHSLGLRVIAEGVETSGQLHALREMGCDEMQGYLFSKPLPVDEFSAFLSSGRRLEIGADRHGPVHR